MNQNKEESKEWQIYALKVDDISKKIAEFFKQEFAGVKGIKPNVCRYGHNKEKLSEMVRDSLGEQNDKKILSVYGSGGFHHLTYGLFSFACKKNDKKYGYIHFDRHTDTGSYTPELSCGEFVSQLSKDMNADVLRIGNSKENDKGIDCEEIHNAVKNGDLESLIEKELGSFPNDVYLSFDLDVMDPEEIKTDYSQGTLRLNELLKIIDIIQKEKNIIGADILGLSNDLYFMGGTKGKEREIKGKRLYSAIASKLLEEKDKKMTDYTKYIKEIKDINKKRFPASPIATYGSLAAVYGAYYFLGRQLEKYFGLKGVAYHAAGAATYLTGMLADNISTIKAVKADGEFYRKHGFHIGCERNPLLPDHPTAKDLWGLTKKGATAGAFELFVLTLSAIFPPVGLGFLTARSFAYSNNSMAAKQTKLMDKLLEERMPNASPEEKKKFLDEILGKEAKAK